jgi:hypothetical protein
VWATATGLELFGENGGMWFDSWADVGRILAVGAAAYVTLVVVLRVSGKRTLTKLNDFDFVVTVAGRPRRQGPFATQSAH